MDDLLGVGELIIHAVLVRRELVHEKIDHYALVSKRARGVETEGFEIPRHHLHRRDAAFVHGRHEFLVGVERHVVGSPEAETLRVGEVFHRGGADGADVDDARIGNGILEAEAHQPLLRGLAPAAVAVAAGGVGHGVRLVEDDDAVEVFPQPGEDLVEARGHAVAAAASERGVGGEENAIVERDGGTLLVALQRRDQQLLHAQRRPVALRVLE